MQQAHLSINAFVILCLRYSNANRLRFNFVNTHRCGSQWRPQNIDTLDTNVCFSFMNYLLKFKRRCMQLMKDGANVAFYVVGATTIT